MLPGKKFFLVMVLLLVSSALGVWYFKAQNIKQKPSLPVSPPVKQTVLIPAKTLSKQEIIRLARNVSDLRRLTKPINPGDSTIAQKLVESDNVLLYSSDPTDTTGRTMLVDTKQNIHPFMGLGIASLGFEASRSGKIVTLRGAWRQVGVFKDWVKVPDSADLYMLLSDPEKNADFLIRLTRMVILNKEQAKGSCYYADRPNPAYLTEFIVQNISVTAERGALDDLGLFGSWRDEDLLKIIKPGDLIVAYNYQYAPENKRKYGMFSKKDGNLALCTEAVLIHRFGGKKQLEKELGKEIPPVKPTTMFGDIVDLYYNSNVEKIPGL